MNRKLLIGSISVLLIATAVGLAIFLSGNKKGSTDMPTVRYAAPLTIAAAPIYVADAKGLWAEENVDVRVSYFDSGRKALDALLSNSAEVMSVSETPPLRAYLAGSEISIVATATEHREAKMTVRADRITKPEDVRGKKVGTVAGTNSDYYMYRWLETHDIGVDEVEIIQLDAAPLAQAFVQGNIDVMFAWEPHNFNASSKLSSSQAESWPTEEYNGRHTIVMNTAYLRNHGDNAERIIKGLIRAEKYIEDNPEDAKRIVSERTGMSSEALNALWDEYKYKVQLDNELSDIIGGQATWIKAAMSGDSATDVAHLVNATYLLNVDKNRVGDRFKL